MDGHGMRRLSLVAVLVVGTALVSCKYESTQVAVPGRDGAMKTSATQRAERRLYDGSPPVIAHENMGADCTECHTIEGMAVPGLGFAPPAPHEITQGLSATSRCEQCHVFKQTSGMFVANSFEGLAQNLRRGKRLNTLAPPVMPHKSFMRENCLACHSGPAAREEIRTPHPERLRCRQCHVEQKAVDQFVSVASVE